MKAQGKNIVVTGGGNRVGRELVLQLLQKGAVVLPPILMKRHKENSNISHKRLRRLVQLTVCLT